jgi:hypothetical protein
MTHPESHIRYVFMERKTNPCPFPVAKERKTRKQEVCGATAPHTSCSEFIPISQKGNEE